MALENGESGNELAKNLLGLRAELTALQTRVKIVSHEVERLSDENAALRECLEKENVLRSQRILALVHKRHFGQVCVQHPCTFLPTSELLPSLLGTPEFMRVLRFAGMRSMQALGAASPTLWRAADSIAGISFTHFYVCGGFCDGKAITNVNRFDVAQGAWEPLPPLNRATFDAAAAVLSGSLYVCGGTDRRVMYATADRFDPSSRSWETIRMLSSPRAGLCAVTLDRHLVLCGGMNSSRRRLATVERWSMEGDPQREALPDLQTARTAAAAAVISDTIFVLGGINNDGNALDTVEHLALLGATGCGSPSTRTWQPGPNLLQPRHACTVVAVGRRLYICGGSSGKQVLSSLERFDPVTGDHETLANMAQPRAGAAGAVLAGTLYIFGGYGPPHEGGKNRMLDCGEHFDLATRRWHNSLSMPGARCGTASVVMTVKL